MADNKAPSKPAASEQPDRERLRAVLNRAAASCNYSADATVLHELAEQLDAAASPEATATLRRERDEARAERDKAHERADSLEKQLADAKGKK